jgi:hypothetical protein
MSILPEKPLTDQNPENIHASIVTFNFPIFKYMVMAECFGLPKQVTLGRYEYA